jgi:hypothetical protein
MKKQLARTKEKIKLLESLGLPNEEITNYLGETKNWEIT